MVELYFSACKTKKLRPSAVARRHETEGRGQGGDKTNLRRQSLSSKTNSERTDMITSVVGVCSKIVQETTNK